MNAARAFLSTILPFPNHRDFSKTLGILRFLARHEGPRRRFIGYDEVIRSLVVALERTADSCTKHPFRALILALKRTAQNATESPFLLVVVSLRCLISDGEYGLRHLKYVLILFRRSTGQSYPSAQCYIANNTIQSLNGVGG